LRKLALCSTVFAIFLFASLASAQQGDAMIGFGTVMAPGANPCSLNSTSGFLVCPEKGGLFTNLGGDVIFPKRIGFAFDATWRTSQGAYGGTGGQPYRPILFDFNAVYQPKITRKVGLDLMGGVGWQTTRYYGYTNTVSCNYFYACYQSSNHFLIDAGAGLRYYVYGHLFLRPEVRFYHIVNNTADFTNSNIVHVGASIGYTIGPD
jgi:hypothetical protein